MTKAERWLQIALSYRETDPDRAKQIFVKIVREFPHTNEAETAQARIYQINHPAAEFSKRLEEGANEREVGAPRTAKHIAKFYGICLAFLVAVLALGMVITAIIPGCTVDTGRGAHGCLFLGPLLELMTFGGFVVLMLYIVFVTPVAGIVYLVAKSREIGRSRKSDGTHRGSSNVERF